MTPRKKKLTDTVVKQAALLFSRGKTVKQVGAHLGLAEPTASKAKAMAEEEGWLSKPRLHLQREEIERLEQLLYCERLKERLLAAQDASAHHLRTLRIFGLEHLSSPGDDEAHRKHLEELGTLAAEHLVDEVLPHVDTVGVSWGGTLFATTRKLDRGELSRMKRTGRSKRITFFPVCGSPPDATTNVLRSSSSLVGLLDEFVNDSAANPNNFAGIVAAVSHRYEPDAVEILWRYFRDDPGFASVFGTQRRRGLVSRIDALLTSVGSPDPQDDPWVSGAAEAAGIKAKTLAECTVGNISGIFLPRPDIDKAAKLVKGVNARWTGVSLKQIKDCARRAVDAGRGGPVIIASGTRKVGILLECIRLGLASEVLIDAELAVGLSKALDEASGKA